MGRPNNNTSRNSGRGARAFAILALFLSIIASFISNDDGTTIGAASASAVAPPLSAARGGGSGTKTKAAARTAASSAAVEGGEAAGTGAGTMVAATAEATASSSATDGTAKPASGNPILQLLSYVKTTAVNFKDGIAQMNSDHRRCNEIRSKQSAFARAIGEKRPRGVKGMQIGGISYEEYDFLRKGLVDRNKLFSVALVSVALPNYFVYYLWSFPDMMPTPFLKGKDAGEVSRERCHAVISAMLDIEKGARVAPWTSKLNPFGRGATERAMNRLGDLITAGSSSMVEYGAIGPAGGRMVLRKLKPQLYSSEPLTKQQRLLAGNVVPKQIIKGLTKAIGADPLNKGASPFGIGAVKHIQSVTMADEFIVDQSVEIDSIGSDLLAEACSARLIGGPGWTDGERREALESWLRETEIAPREEATKGGDVHFNGSLARAALMCYNAVDGTRDARADSSLLRAMYQGQKNDAVILN